MLSSGVLHSLTSEMAMQETSPQSGMRGAVPAEDAGDSWCVRGGGVGCGDDCGAGGGVDELVRGLWRRRWSRIRGWRSGVALVAVGGYGRRELFPYSDVDLLFLLDGKLAEKDVKDAIRRVNQEMWDCGIRVSPVTRRLAECERFDPENAEFALSLMDHRLLTGDAALYEKLAGQWCRSCCSGSTRR